MGHPKWTKDNKFDDALSRWNNRNELDALIRTWTTKHGHYEAMELLQKAGVAAGASLNVEEVCENPHLNEREFLVDIEYPDKSMIRRLAFPWKSNDSGRGVYTHPPEVGDQNDYVFKEIMGLSDEEIKRLEAEKVIY